MNARNKTSSSAPLRRPKISELIAEKLTEDIHAKGWPVGQSIGTESELMKRFNVSRATIIEAARQVEVHGIAAMRRGSGGGLFVINSARTAVSRAIATYFELSNFTIAEQYESSRIVETAAARLAAEETDEATALTLREAALSLSEAQNGLELHSKAMKLRIAIADASGNVPLSLFMRSLARVLTNYVRPDLRAHYRDISFEHGVAADMWALTEGIVAGDASLADKFARQDVERRERRARTLGVDAPLLEQGPLRRDTDNKLSEMVALAIRNDIARSGWQVGTRLANEGDLPLRYGSSQWVIRQAIRLLELHGIVVMKRGQGGGLFVGQPNADYTVNLAASFFAVDLDLAQSGVLEMRRHMLKNIARFAAIRGTAGEARALVELCSNGNNDASFSWDAFSRLLSTMARNRILAIFVQILDRLVTDRMGDAVQPKSAKDALSVAEAISLGDAPLARHRMHYFAAML